MITQAGRILAPATTGEQTYNIANFGVAPKAIILWTGYRTTNGFNTANEFCLGLGTSAANQVVIGGRSRHNQAISSTSRHQLYQILEIRQESNIQNTLLAASLVSFGVDGTNGQFTLDWLETNENRIINYIVFGGEDFNANLVELQAPSVSGIESYAHGLGITPDALIGISASNSTPPTSAINNLILSFGLWSSTSQVNSVVASTNNVNPSASYNRLTDKFISNISTTGTLTRDAIVSSVNSINISLDWNIVSAASTYNWVLCFSGVKATTGLINSPISGDLPVSQNINLSDISPKSALFLSTLLPTSANIENNASLMIGTSDGTNNTVSGFLNSHNISPTNVQRWTQNKAISIGNDSGTEEAGATVTLNDNIMSLSWDNIDATAYSIAYLAFGEEYIDPNLLIPGVVSFVSSGTNGIVLEGTDSTGGDTPYSYQWQKSTNNQDFTNIDGATTLELTDTDVEVDIVYYYRLEYTDNNLDSVYSNVVSVQLYTGGPIQTSGAVIRHIGQNPFITF